MSWFNFNLWLKFHCLCFKLIIIHYDTPKQREIKSKPRIKLNHNKYKIDHVFLNYRHPKKLDCTSFSLKKNEHLYLC